MARIRTIKPEFFLHEGLVALEAQHGVRFQLRVLYPALWCLADREGRFKWRPERIRVQAMPYDEGVDVGALLDVLAGGGFIERYEVGGETYGWIPALRKHQRVRGDEAASTLPAPPAPCVPPKTSVAPRGPQDSDGPVTAQSTTRHCAETDPHRGREGKGKEGKGSGKELNTRPSREDAPDALSVTCSKIIEHLNQRAGTFFDPNAPQTVQLVQARLNEGRTLQDFLDVIDDRCYAWLDDERMRQYLRPSTLFNATKMETYLGTLGPRAERWRDLDDTPPLQLRFDAEHMAAARPDELDAWLRSQPLSWQRELAREAGLDSWSNHAER